MIYYTTRVIMHYNIIITLCHSIIYDIIPQYTISNSSNNNNSSSNDNKVTKAMKEQDVKYKTQESYIILYYMFIATPCYVVQSYYNYIV